MNKALLLLSPLLILSSNAFACSGDVQMSIPHIHNEEQMLISVRDSKQDELKRIDIYQIFSTSKKNYQYDTTIYNEEAIEK